MAGFANTAPNDGHLNEQGHAVVARELVQAICGIAVSPDAAGAIQDSFASSGSAKRQ
jgi:hypothetical protein